MTRTSGVANAATDHLLNGGERGFNSDDLPGPMKRHIFRWTPAWVLPHVVAMRKILELHQIVQYDDTEEYACSTCNNEDYGGHGLHPAQACPTLRALAEALGNRGRP